MAKWMLRMGALAALGLVAAMVVLAMCGDPLATLPHAGGALALDFLQVLAVLVALLALLISSTVRTLNRSANIALDAETVAHEYNELIASARDVVREIEKKRPATFSDLTAQVDTIDRLVDSEDASRFERKGRRHSLTLLRRWTRLIGWSIRRTLVVSNDGHGRLCDGRARSI